MKYLIIIFIFTSVCTQKFPYRIRNFWINKCGNQIINLDNVQVSTDTNNNLIFSGNFSTNQDLVSPIKMSIDLKRKVWLMWVPVPCIKDIGTCTYDDLCRYGAKENDVCPSVLSENNIPCRCPIPEGNYTIPRQVSMFEEKFKNIYSGKYIGRANIYHYKQTLGCFDFKITLY